MLLPKLISDNVASSEMVVQGFSLFLAEGGLPMVSLSDLYFNILGAFAF